MSWIVQFYIQPWNGFFVVPYPVVAQIINCWIAFIKSTGILLCNLSHALDLSSVKWTWAQFRSKLRVIDSIELKNVESALRPKLVYERTLRIAKKSDLWTYRKDFFQMPPYPRHDQRKVGQGPIAVFVQFVHTANRIQQYNTFFSNDVLNYFWTPLRLVATYRMIPKAK